MPSLPSKVERRGVHFSPSYFYCIPQGPFLPAGGTVISWKKFEPISSSSSSSGFRYLATSAHVMDSGGRVSVELIDGRASTLVVALASRGDIGEYVCEVSSQPVATLKHQVSIIGRGDPWNDSS